VNDLFGFGETVYLFKDNFKIMFLTNGCFTDLLKSLYDTFEPAFGEFITVDL